MDVSVIIVNYNVSAFLYQCLLSVEAALKTINGEIIVVDNASSDDSCVLVKAFFPQVVLIENQKNLGFSKANNQGVHQAKGDYLLILNPDTVIGENTLQTLLNLGRKNPNFGIVSLPMYDGMGQYLPESKRNIPTPWISLQKMLGYDINYYASEPAMQESGAIQIATGAVMWIKKDIYLQVGGFDEAYFMYGEDIDLSYKLLKAGYSNYYYASLPIIHYKGESTQKDAKYLNNFFGAMHLFYKKHYKNKGWLYPLFATGIIVWKGIKYLNIKHSERKPLPIEQNILYIGSENQVFEALQRIYNQSQLHIYAVCETRVISRFDDLERIQQTIREKNIDSLVFEQTNNSFLKIIFYITQLSIPNVRFRIHPKGANFIIGSDDKNTKGVVTSLM